MTSMLSSKIKNKWVFGLIGLLIIGGTIFLLHEKEVTPEKEIVRELKKFAVNGKTVTGEFILSPGARGSLKIDHRVNEEALRWMGHFALDLRLANISEREILYFELVYFLTDREGNLHPESKETVRKFTGPARTLTFEEIRQLRERFPGTEIAPRTPLPGKGINTEVNFGKLGDLWEPAHGFIIEIRNLHFIEEPAARKPVPEEPVVEPGLSPSQVLKAFFKALREGRYAEASGYIRFPPLELEELNKNPPPELRYLLPEITVVELLEKKAEYIRKTNTMAIRVEILKEEIDGNWAEVPSILYLSNGTKEEMTALMVKEGNVWKIDY